MGDITRIRKTYELLDIKEVEDLPPGWKFEINGKSWDFKTLADWSNRRDLAYWFSVVFWRSRSLQTNATREEYWYAYKKFWKFLERTNSDILAPEHIDSNVLYSFRSWLNYQRLSIKNDRRKAGFDTLSHGTKRKIFGTIKQTIKRLISINTTRTDLILPNAVYLGSNIASDKTLPFSQSERQHIVDACNAEIELIKAKKIINLRHIYVPYVLILALRTGLNVQPLLDLTVDSIKPSILEGRLELSFKKNRGYSSNRISVEDNVSVELAFVSKRIGPLIRELIDISDRLRNKAPAEVSGSIWLVSEKSGNIRVMTPSEMWINIQRFRDKYALTDDSGNPLQLNIRRMRPTFAHSLLRINGGDIRDLQKRLHHKNISTTLNYLDANQEEFKSSFRFRGIIMQYAFGGGNPKTLASQLQCSLQEAQKILSGNNRTIAGSCRNPLDSPFKQKDGTDSCTRFMACFRCHNQIITKEDSHKIFSFYWFLLNKKNLIPRRAWEQNYEWIIRTIDEDISPNLGTPDEIEALKQKASTNPHPAWPNDLKETA